MVQMLLPRFLLLLVATIFFAKSPSIVAFVPSSNGYSRPSSLLSLLDNSYDSSFDGTFSSFPQTKMFAVLPDSFPSPVPSFLISENAILDRWNEFQDNHTFLQGLLLTIAVKILIGEVRRRIEKPILDEAGRRVGKAAKEGLTPDIEEVKVGDWAKLGGCVAMDLAGDASELIPFLGEFTDVAFAPAEAALLQILFKSPIISAFGFVEEILPFTDVVPTFTLSWLLSTLFPTTPLAKGLLPSKSKETKENSVSD